MPALALTDEQKQVVQTKIVSLHRPASDVVAFLAPIAKFDAAGDQTRKRIGCSSGIAFLLAFVSFFVIVVTPYILIATAALIVTGIALAIVAKFRGKTDLSDNLRATALPFLAALREDFGSEPIEIKLDLRPPTSAAKMINQRHGSSSHDTYTTYRDPWMTGRGTMRDGTELEWSVVDTILEHRYWKRTARGKSKLKTKVKKHARVNVAVTAKSKRFEVGAVDGARVKQGENKNVVRRSAKIKRPDKEPIRPAEVLNAFTAVFGQLRAAR